MRKTLIVAGAVSAALALASGAAATTISWATLTSSDGSNVSGSITTSSGTVTFTADSNAPYDFANINNTGTNYWTGTNYTYNIPYNQPQTSDIVALGAANTETITFSAPVTNLYLALNSYNGASVTLSQPFVIASQGCGYWGCGSFVPTGADSFNGVDEAVGILEIPGTITSLTMTDTTSETWHGFTVGIGSLGTPEPAAWSLMLLGVGAVGGVMRNRRRAQGALGV